MNRKLEIHKNRVRKLIMYGISMINRLFPYNHDMVFVRRDRIGDFIIWLGCAQQLKRYYSSRKFTLICSKYNYEIARLSGVFDKIIIVNDEFYESFRVIGVHCRCLISPTQSRTFVDELIAIGVSGEEKIVLEGDETNNPDRCLININKVYTRVITTTKEVVPEITLNSLFCNKLLGDNESKVYYADLSSMIVETGISDRYYVLNMGASANWKRWPVINFIKLAQLIKEKQDIICVLTGASSETPLGAEFLNGYSGKVINLIGKTSIKEMISVMDGADFVVTNDTAAVHVCAACDTKCYCIISGVHYGRFTQYPSAGRKNPPEYILALEKSCFGCLLADNNNHKMLDACCEMQRNDKLVPCVAQISVNSVFEAINKQDIL